MSAPATVPPQNPLTPLMIPELLSIILRMARNNSTPRQYQAILAVCGTWHDYGAEYRKETINITTHSIERFAASLRARPLTFNFVKILSITVELQFPRRPTNAVELAVIDFRRGRQNELMIRALEYVVRHLNLLKSLHTFSLRIGRRYDQDSFGRVLQTMNLMNPNQPFSHESLLESYTASIRRHIVLDALMALPQKVTNVEIDTQGLDRPLNRTNQQPEYHICEAVRAILPRLKSLRLRLYSICSHMFNNEDGTPVIAPNLYDLTINFGLARPHLQYWSKLGQSTRLCPQSTDSVSAADDVRNRQLFREMFNKKLEVALAAGAFPSIKYLETLFPNPALERDEGILVKSYHYDRVDILKGITTIHTVFVFPPDINGVYPERTTFLVGRNREDSLVVGTADAVETDIERSWGVTQAGGRVPHSLAIGDEGKRAGMEFKKEVQSLEEWMPLWAAGAQTPQIDKGRHLMVKGSLRDVRMMRCIEMDPHPHQRIN